MRHLTIQQLSATVDDALSGVSLELVRRHLVECEECRQRGMRLSRIDAVVAQLVSHDPGDEWFASLAIEVEERVEGEIASRFEAPAHPAGPPPLEVAASSPSLTPEQLDAIWEEGSTTPRPAVARPAEPAPSASEPAPSGAGSPSGNAAPPPPAVTPIAIPESQPIEAAAPREPLKVTDARLEEREIAEPRRATPPPPMPAPPRAKTPEKPAPRKPAAVEPPATIAKPAPGAQPAPVARPAAAEPARREPVAAAAAKTSPAAAPAPTPPSARRAPGAGEGGSRWQTHAERVVRARREARAPRETLLPLTLGLAGGAIAGALVVTLFFLRHDGSAGSAKTASAPRNAAPTAAISPPVERPSIEPVAPVADSVRNPEPRADAEPVTIPHSAQLTPHVKPAPRGAVARVTPVRVPATSGGRALPTDEESWPLLCGEVVDESGAPVAGARILLADLDVGARTDRRGRFCLSTPPGDRTLSVVALGFATQRRAVSVAPGVADVHLVLKAAP